MTHLFKKFKYEFDSIDLILIERQPPTGLVAVEQLIMREYRKKCKLVSPVSMLNFFGILQYEYSERKVHTEKIAMEYLSSLKVFIFNERRHDMADAFCILYYYLSMKRNEYIEKQKKIEDEIITVPFKKYLEKFKYLPV
jgi:hypothetical protein